MHASVCLKIEISSCYHRRHCIASCVLCVPILPEHFTSACIIRLTARASSDRGRLMGHRRVDAPSWVPSRLRRHVEMRLTAAQAAAHLTSEGWCCSTADVENLKRMHGISRVWRGSDDELAAIIRALLDSGSCGGHGCIILRADACSSTHAMLVCV